MSQEYYTVLLHTASEVGHEDIALTAQARDVGRAAIVAPIVVGPGILEGIVVAAVEDREAVGEPTKGFSWVGGSL